MSYFLKTRVSHWTTKWQVGLAWDYKNASVSALAAGVRGPCHYSWLSPGAGVLNLGPHHACAAGTLPYWAIFLVFPFSFSDRVLFIEPRACPLGCKPWEPSCLHPPPALGLYKDRLPPCALSLSLCVCLNAGPHAHTASTFYPLSHLDFGFLFVVGFSWWDVRCGQAAGENCLHNLQHWEALLEPLLPSSPAGPVVEAEPRSTVAPVLAQTPLRLRRKASCLRMLKLYGCLLRSNGWLIKVRSGVSNLGRTSEAFGNF